MPARRRPVSRPSRTHRPEGADIAARGRVITDQQTQDALARRLALTPRVVRALVDPDDAQRIIAHPEFS